MYASEAREITVSALKDSVDEIMQDIFGGIKEKAKLGKSDYFIRKEELPKDVDIDVLASRLQEFGYVTQVFNGYGYMAAGIEIRWRNYESNSATCRFKKIYSKTENMQEI